MQDREIEAIEKAITNATVDELYEECQRYRRHKSAAAQETLAILQRLLEQRLAEDEQSPTEWSKSQEPKKKPLSPAEEKRREEKRIERETQGGSSCRFRKSLNHRTAISLSTASIKP